MASPASTDAVDRRAVLLARVETAVQEINAAQEGLAALQLDQPLVRRVHGRLGGVVARSFYDEPRARPDKPFAAIMRDISARADEGSDPEDSYAAHCLYGDPLAAQVPPRERTS